MQNTFARFLSVVCLAFAALPASLSSAPLFLGEPPAAPTDVSHLPRVSAMGLRLLYGGFTVNTSSREEVRSFYNAVYRASDNVPIEATSDVASCYPGDTAQDFKDAVLRRINWYRAMAGIPADITLNAVNNAKNQQAALIMSRNYQLSHTPPASWGCWTQEGYDAANNSNIGLGTCGPDTVTGYIEDYGDGNQVVGHRRWLLYPQTKIMGTGDVPEQGAYWPANAIWVLDGHYFDPRPATRSGFVAWPPAGYAPKQVVFPRWSISYPNANFANATITMHSNGVPVSILQEPIGTGAGENTLVWIPMNLNPDQPSAAWPFSGQDTVYAVNVGNVIIGSRTTNWSYTVTVFDPTVPGPDHAPVISGPSEPAVGQPNLYTFTPIPHATAYQWRYMKRLPWSFADGAEAGLGNFTPDTSPTYNVITTSPKLTGSYAFQLGHPSGAPDQILTLNQTFIPQAATTLSFMSRLLSATADQVAKVQISLDDGEWFDIFSQQGAGAPGETSWQSRTFPLGAYAGSMVRPRFGYFYEYQIGSFYPGASTTVGWHLDDIAVSSSLIPDQPITNSVATTQFQFTPPQAGEYALQARATIFTDFPLGWGPQKIVEAAAAAPVILARDIRLVSGQAQIDFLLQSGTASSFKLLQAPQLSGPWTTNNSAVLTTLTPGVSYRFTAPIAGSQTFYRIKTP